MRVFVIKVVNLVGMSAPLNFGKRVRLCDGRRHVTGASKGEEVPVWVSAIIIDCSGRSSSYNLM